MTLDYPLFSLPCILVSPQATQWLLCLYASPHRGVGARPSPQLPHQVSFAAFVNEKPVWAEVGLKIPCGITARNTDKLLT